MTSAIDENLYNEIWCYMRDYFPSTGFFCLEEFDEKMNPQTAKEYSEVLSKVAENLSIVDLNEYDRNEAIEEADQEAHDHGHYHVSQDILNAIGEDYPETYFEDVMKDAFRVVFDPDEGPLLNIQAERGVGKSREDSSEIVDFVKCVFNGTELYAELPVDDQDRKFGKLNSDLYEQIEEKLGNVDNYRLDYGRDLYSKFRAMSKEEKIASVEDRVPVGVMKDAERPKPEKARVADRVRENQDTINKRKENSNIGIERKDREENSL